MSILLFTLLFAPRKHHPIHLLSAVTLMFSLQHMTVCSLTSMKIPGWMRVFSHICLSSSVLVVFLDSGSNLFIFCVTNSEKIECKLTQGKKTTCLTTQQEELHWFFIIEATEQLSSYLMYFKNCKITNLCRHVQCFHLTI